MSAPFINPAHAFRYAGSEIISGISALNMLPEPVEPAPGDMGFLSQTDANVAHAIEHFRAAMSNLDALDKRIAVIAARARALVEKMEAMCDHLAHFGPETLLEDNCIAGLADADNLFSEIQRLTN